MEKEMEKLEKWAETFHSIGHPIRMALVFMLYGSEVLFGEHCLTLPQIREVLGFPNTKRAINIITYHLGQLIKINFVKREPHQTEEGISRVSTKYHLSNRGRAFLNDFNLATIIRDYLTRVQKDLNTTKG